MGNFIVNKEQQQTMREALVEAIALCTMISANSEKVGNLAEYKAFSEKENRYKKLYELLTSNLNDKI